MTAPRLLDLFCGAGGAAMGYHQAGFEVVGIDCAFQPSYPFGFVQGDALTYIQQWGTSFDCLHASPPCQGYSALKHFVTKDYRMLITEVREALRATGQPYIIENVVGAPLDPTLLLCGSMFGLQTACGAQLRRHRLFESNVLLMSPGPCQHNTQTCQATTISIHGKKAAHPRQEGDLQRRRTITVTGSTPQQNVERNRRRVTFSVADAQHAMGIDWMGMAALSQAIPPAYTAWIGRQVRQHLEDRRHA